LSWRAVSVSGCLSTASVCLTLAAIDTRSTEVPVELALFFLLASASLIPALMTHPHHASWRQRIPAVAFVIVVSTLLIGVIQIETEVYWPGRWHLIVTNALAYETYLVALSLPFSIASDFFSIAVGRRILTLVQQSNSLLRLILLFLASLVLPAVLVGLPVALQQLPVGVYRESSLGPDILQGLVYLALSNLISTLVGALFAAIATLALLHWLIWPILRRPVMAAHRQGLLKQRKLLWTIGVGLIAVSTPLGGSAMAYLHAHFGL
jgi:hypothetical protein